MSEELIDGIAYVGHPFDGKKLNIAKSKAIIEEIHKRYPCLILLNPLSIFEYEEYSSRLDEYTTHMVDCLTLLNRCDCLILTGDWQNSKGCLCEWGFAQSKKGMQIFEWHERNLRVKCKRPIDNGNCQSAGGKIAYSFRLHYNTRR